MRAFEILNEMIVRTGSPDNGNTVIALGAYIWMFDPKSSMFDENAKLTKEERAIIKDIKEKTGIKATNLWDIEQEVRDSRPDVLIGSIHNSELPTP